ncbi:hypothetical protein F4556_005730 [Kitasatospora gansuensis]|uniref:HTH cro/C1-type domain-containing protein n=2 Tax=Kitasatospora TaxID=2063 RepID=A0A7W7SGT3_9ACTN|nr:helix-turn-helix transcriptional regulator [Kitasatospora gansuensis]MBB4950195.1 hypothetical protein [Kitasatospora gansuensis]
MTTSIARVDRTTRRRSERTAREIRLRGIREGSPRAEVVDRILVALPEVHPLEAHRWSHGWDRAELSTRIDLEYVTDGLHPPALSDTEICRWEHGQRRPSEERIDYLCRVYETRPDRLGYGRDYSGAMLGHLEQAGLADLFPLTNVESKADLISRIRGARSRIDMFGLTRNFYGSDEMLPLFIAKAREIPVRIYIMDPHCDSRRDRYRLEPTEAAMEEPTRYEREVLRPLAEAATAAKVDLRIYLYNFPCSFAMERFDDTIRVMLYGHGKRGTDGPILTWTSGTEYHEYFAGQLDWVARLGEADVIPEPWRSKGVRVWRYQHDSPS